MDFGTDARYRLKDEDVAFLVAFFMPGGGQLYVHDWALGSYLMGVVTLVAPMLWSAGQTVAAFLAVVLTWGAGFVLVRPSVRAYNLKASPQQAPN